MTSSRQRVAPAAYTAPEMRGVDSLRAWMSAVTAGNQTRVDRLSSRRPIVWMRPIASVSLMSRKYEAWTV